ncbi:MAG: S8 family serine peptidase, partial [Bacteroidota bacterium]
MRVHSGKELTTGMQAFDAVAKTTTAKNMYRLFPYDPQHESKLRKHGLHLWYVVELDPATNPKQAAAIYKKVKGVAVAEADHEKVLSPFQVSEYKGGISPMSATPFNDPYLPSQWHYENTGQTGYPNGADVNLYEAWKITAGSRDVIVSIHDQGVDVAHNDLAANMWVNTAEKNGTPDVDDDGNGYVDDIHGWNFDNNNGKIDAQFHGTHVAGTVGAVNNNGIGVSGVAGGTGANDGVRIMSLQILGGGSAENSYIYAANNGAVISQNSWGYINPGSYDQSVLDAIDYFIAEAGNYAGSPMKGGVVIFASGNNNMDAPFYPAYHPGVIAVNSIGPDYKKASYSNYGAWTEISAPGGEVSLGSQNGVLSTLPNNKVGYLQGTSMACPHVSGIAALALAARTHQFTAAELTNKLLTGVVDIDSSNPDYIGKLGSGLIDAKFAIQHDQHKAPEVISDLQITAMTQEFATLRWTVPADEDDNKPVSFTLYYHTSPLTPENLIDAEKINLANKLTAGETANAEVNGLLGLTTYYFGVVSQDRWGNLSMLSNIAQGTTNEGPQIDVDEDSKSINLSIDASGATEAEHSITILNQAEGLLRWSSLTRNKDHELSWSSAGLQYPVLKKAKIASAGVLSRKLSSASSQQRTDIAPASFETIEKGYGWGWPIVMVGETDTTLSNSSATRFEVTEDEGFNLTHVKMWLRHNTENGPIILEVYEGEVVQKKNLVFAQEFTAPTNFEDNYSIRLDEQLFFEKGKVFWIAFHVPSGTIYPLGIAEALDNDFSKNCLMSFDLGKTWTSLPDLLHDNRYVWSTRAASYNKHLGNYLTLEPSSGEVNGNESGSTVLTANASALINGTYKANVIVQSNDADTPELRLPVELTVSGHQPDIRSTDIVNFGSVFRGTTKDVTITVRNEGYGNFNSPNVTISDPRFEIVGYAPWRIAAREEEEIIIRFKPTGAGNVNAMLVLESGAITHTVALFGVGTEPSEIKITPATQTFNNLALGDEVDATVTIENTGEYALKYFIPGYDTKGISNNWPEPYHRYGYTFHTSLPSDPAPATYEWNDISTTGTDITTFF